MQQQTSIAPIESSIEFSVIPFPQNRFCGAVARWLNIIWCLHMTYFSEHLFTAQFVNCWFACSLFIHQIPQKFTQYSMDYTSVFHGFCLCVEYVPHTHNALYIITIFHRRVFFVSILCVCVCVVNATRTLRIICNVHKAKSLSVCEWYAFSQFRKKKICFCIETGIHWMNNKNHYRPIHNCDELINGKCFSFRFPFFYSMNLSTFFPLTLIM